MSIGTAPKRSSLPTIVTLGLISALASMAIHMLAPALPMLGRDLGSSISQTQLVISTYLIGLGIGQLLAGPLLDRLGRMPVLLAGLALFAVGSLASAMATGLDSLLVARLLQAVGGAAGLVSSRVLVGDIFSREESMGQQASLMMIVLISPALAPVLGGYLANASGWRIIPVVLAAGSVPIMIAAALILPSQILRSAGLSAAKTRVSLRTGLGRLARNHTFLMATCSLAAGSSALYMFLASGAFLLEQEFGLGERAAGMCFLLVAGTSVIGTRLVRPISRRMDTLFTGAGCILAGSLCGMVLALLGIVGPVPLIAPMLLVGLGAGISGPAAINLVVYAEEGLAGTATSLAGAIQMLVSGAATVMIGWVAPLTPVKLSIALSIVAGVAAMSAWSRKRAL